MKLSELRALLEATGLPVAYRAFPEGEAPPLPFVCYLVSGSNNFAADGVVYLPVDRVAVELYTRYKDPDTEAMVEKALDPFVWTKEEIYLDTERCYEIRYEIEV